MAELERLANHFGDIGAICNDASFVLMHAQTSILRERCLRAADVCFGHRLMMDRIVPGGLARKVDGGWRLSSPRQTLDEGVVLLPKVYLPGGVATTRLLNNSWTMGRDDCVESSSSSPSGLDGGASSS